MTGYADRYTTTTKTFSPKQVGVDYNNDNQ
jgi:hypothetical protein